jgi:hypothetical protein
MERFLFAPVNPTHATVFRIALALGLPVLFWFNGLDLFPTKHNIPWLPELYKHVFTTKPYRLFTFGVLILFGVGWQPRATGWLLVVLLLPWFLTYGRLSQQILLFTLLAFSFIRSDAQLSLYRGFHRNQPASAGPMWPIRLIQLQLSVTYGANALAKTTPEYLSGDVLEGMSRMLPNFLVDLSDGYLHAGPLIIPVALAAVASAVTEYYLAIGFWFRRLLVITAVVGVSFHLILKMIVKIGMFDWACMFLYLAFLLPFDRPAARGLTEGGGKAILNDTPTSHGV